jgi:hypothetical protein
MIAADPLMWDRPNSKSMPIGYGLILTRRNRRCRMNSFHALPSTHLSRYAKMREPAYLQARSLTLEDPGVAAMTDFAAIRAYAIEPTATLRAANDKMIACGIRLLFVVDAEQRVIGLITANDLLGERPVQYLHEHAGDRESILVQDIMTAWEYLEAVDYAAVCRCSVGDIVETMKEAGRQHMLVIESAEVGVDVIRGLFSTTQIGRQLGVEIMPVRANSFAELESAIAT